VITVTEHALEAMQLPLSPSHAVCVAREKMTDGTTLVEGAGCKLISKLLGLTIDYKQFLDEASAVKEENLIDYELTATQAVVEAVVRSVGTPVDETDLLIKAKARALKFVTNPDAQYFFKKADASASGQPTTEVAFAPSVDVKVAVKADGTIKKGGKEVLAIALYEKHVKNAETPMTNQEFIAVLVKELGMSKAGATTYNYNMKKKFGGKIEPKKAK
jgi:hypothetical protein